MTIETILLIYFIVTLSVLGITAILDWLFYGIFWVLSQPLEDSKVGDFPPTYIQESRNALLSGTPAKLSTIKKRLKATK